MKKLISLILILAVGISLGVLIKQNPGIVVVQWHNWRIDSPLWLAVFAIVLGGVVVYYLMRIVLGIFSTPAKLVHFKHNWEQKHARKLMHQGLMDLVEGHWQQASRHLQASVSHSEAPLLNYLGLARSAQEQGDDKARDRYLRLAHEKGSGNGSKMAVGLTQAQLQYEHGQYEQSLATLKHLQSLSPHHPRILSLLKRVYQHLNEWDQLLKLLPNLRKNHVVSPDELMQLEREAFIHKLSRAEKSSSAEEIKKVWHNLPRKYHQDPVMVYQYANALISHREPFEAENCLRQAIKREWRESLIRLYGQIDHPEPDKLLLQAEGWLKTHGQSASLMLTLGRLSCAAQLWGKAERYFEASINIKPDVEAYTELACLYEKLDKLELSHKFFRKGATMVSMPVLERLPMHHINEVNSADAMD